MKFNLSILLTTLLLFFGSQSFAGDCRESVKIQVSCDSEEPSLFHPIKIKSFRADFKNPTLRKLGPLQRQCNFKAAEFELELKYLDRTGSVFEVKVEDSNHLKEVLENLAGLGSEEKDWVRYSLNTPTLDYSKSKLSNRFRTWWLNWGVGGFGRDRDGIFSYPNAQISAGDQPPGNGYRSLNTADNCKLSTDFIWPEI